MRNRGVRGSVLVTVIWILSVFAIFSVVITRNVSQELFLGKWSRDRTLSRILAKAGVERVLYEIQADEFTTFDALNEKWAVNPVAFDHVKLGEGELIVTCDAFEPVEGSNEPFEFDAIHYGACDESGRMNMNTATEIQIINLLKVVAGNIDEKEAMTIAHSILDWVDEDEEVRTQGAEASFYKAFKEYSPPRNGPMQSIQEIRMVRGVSQELYKKLEPHVTVYTDGKVNFNTAKAAVFQGLGIGPELALAIVEFRKGEDGIIGNEDDQVFQLVDGITPALSAAGSFSSEDFAQIANLISAKQVTVKSKAYRIRSIGRFIRDSRVFDYEIFAIMTRQGDILFWQEAALG